MCYNKNRIKQRQEKDMNKVLVGSLCPEKFIAELNKNGISTGRYLDGESPKEDIEMAHELEKLYKIEDYYKTGCALYLECDTDDIEKVQDIYRELIKNEQEDYVMDEREKEYLRQCREEWERDFEKEYGYKVKSREYKPKK